MKLTYEHIPGTLALVDGDVLVYRIGYTTEEETEEIALIRMNKYIDEIVYNAKVSDYQIFLSPSIENNFRFYLYPEYKNNRTQPKPKHYQALRKYLIDYEQALVARDQEADDEMGIAQTDSTIICSIDKDLLMIPGRHYNFVKDKHTYITEEEGLRNFYRQLLTGDKTDNIPGLPKVGPKTAEKILGEANDEDSYKAAVLKEYQTRLSLDEMAATERINTIGRLLWIRREEGEIWSL